MQAQYSALTAIANFLSWLGQRSSVFCSALAALFITAGCDTLKTRDDVSHQPARQRQATTKQEASTLPGITGTPAPQTLPTTGPEAVPPVAAPAEPAPPPTFLNKELPKVGLIFGPGGMKTFAQIGVMREFSRARIPVHAVAGLEWGAVMAGLYAQQGQVNDMEWRAFKLKENEVASEGFLSRGIKAQPISAMSEFLDTAFGSAAVDRAKVEFACPAYWVRADRGGMLNRGSWKDALKACVPYPPLYTDGGGVIAAPFAVEPAATWLRSRGAEVIILINVLSQAEAQYVKKSGDSVADNLLWSEIRREVQQSGRPPLVTHVINISTSGSGLAAYGNRRALMESGSKAAADAVNKIAAQYGF